MSPATLCIVVQIKQRASQRYFFNNNELWLIDLTTNRAVGSSNLSGRALTCQYTVCASGGRPAAVNPEAVAGHHPGDVGCKIQRSDSHVVWLAHLA